MVVNVVLFSGGRGSGALTRQLLSQPGVNLTIVINGYDDGASTGAVRRFLGDSLGPSDFRKNASRVAAALETCPPSLIALLDRRLPADLLPTGAADLIDRAAQEGGEAVAQRLARFRREDADLDRRFDYTDCAIGNLVFAGSYLLAGRDFNRAVEDYTALLGVPSDVIENVTDGVDARLVAVGSDGRFFPSEAALVAAGSSARINDIFLLTPPLSPEEERACIESPEARARLLRERSVLPRLNPRLPGKIAAADLIVYAPGTQHSSLFPSYLTDGLAESIAANLHAIKLLVTNIEPDVEITGSSAVELIDRALYYLRRRGTLQLPTPALITHYLLNDPGHREQEHAYVPLGQIDTVEDPRLFRIGNYEQGITGRHDATRVLGPFIESILKRGVRRRVAILFQDSGSLNKVAQSLLEMVRGGIDAVPVDPVVYYLGTDGLDETFARSLPFPTVRLRHESEFQERIRDERFDYAMLFESSGMYRGEDLVGMLSHLPPGRLDAVWGSRRLSMRDIEASYAMRYRKNALLGTVSYIGSHILSLAYLVMFGRYITDTLSGIRVVRATDMATPVLDLRRKDANHQLLSGLLRRKADVLEVPVQFLPLAPDRVKRTTVSDGIRALATIVAGRWRRASA